MINETKGAENSRNAPDSGSAGVKRKYDDPNSARLRPRNYPTKHVKADTEQEISNEAFIENELDNCITVDVCGDGDGDDGKQHV